MNISSTGQRFELSGEKLFIYLQAPCSLLPDIELLPHRSIHKCKLNEPFLYNNNSDYVDGNYDNNDKDDNDDDPDVRVCREAPLPH